MEFFHLVQLSYVSTFKFSSLLPLSITQGRPCDVSDVLADLVEAVSPLAHKQQRLIKLSELEQALQVAIEEPALRQALSNLIEGALLRTHVGGRVEIVCMRAPAGGALVVIEDDGPDMHYMVITSAYLFALCWISFYFHLAMLLI